MQRVVKTKKSGFVILYAMIISTVVLIIGVSLMNIMTKQLVLSSISRNAKNSYYASVAGWECANFWRNGGENYFGRLDESNNFVSPDKMNDVFCGDSADSISNSCSGVPCTTNLILNLSGNLCAEVRVIFDTDSSGNPSTKIESDGYNSSCENLKSGAYNPRRVKALYYDR